MNEKRKIDDIDQERARQIPIEREAIVKRTEERVVKEGIKAKIYRHPEFPITSLQSHLNLYGGTAGDVLKCLCFVSEEGPLIVMASGEVKIDLKKLSKESGKHHIQMASLEELKEHFGTTPGGIGPLSLPENIPVFIEHKLLEKTKVVGSAGSPCAGVEIEPSEILKIVNGKVCDLYREDSLF